MCAVLQCDLYSYYSLDFYVKLSISLMHYFLSSK